MARTETAPQSSSVQKLSFMTLTAMAFERTLADGYRVVGFTTDGWYVFRR